MTNIRADVPATSILAVIVLYQRPAFQSVAVSSLFQILNTNFELAKHFSVVLYDNSLEPNNPAMRADFPVHYVHDPANGGLASAYNFALARAESEQRGWLLLFDQDTSTTREFLSELMESIAVLYAQAGVGAIVPKLLVGGSIFSPEEHFLHQLRRQYQRSNQMATKDVLGLQQRQLNAYNSGATIRVSALRAIGGFPPEFWLDYLDHAVFSRLFASGFRIFVMGAQLEHSYSLDDIESMPAWRLKNIFSAQTLFVRQSGNFFDRLLYRMYLLRFFHRLRRSRKDFPIWRQAALQALLLRVPDRQRPKPSRTGIDEATNISLS